jgi:hypothetical protein
VPAKELELLWLEVCPYLALMLLPVEVGEPVVLPPNLVAMQQPLIHFIFSEMSFKAAAAVIGTSASSGCVFLLNHLFSYRV